MANFSHFYATGGGLALAEGFWRFFDCEAESGRPVHYRGSHPFVPGPSSPHAMLCSLQHWACITMNETRSRRELAEDKYGDTSGVDFAADA